MLASDNQTNCFKCREWKITMAKRIAYSLLVRRGFIIEKDLSNNENLYISVGSNLFKINASNGNLIKNLELMDMLRDMDCVFSIYL